MSFRAIFFWTFCPSALTGDVPAFHKPEQFSSPHFTVAERELNCRLNGQNGVDNQSTTRSYTAELFKGKCYQIFHTSCWFLSSTICLVFVCRYFSCLFLGTVEKMQEPGWVMRCGFAQQIIDSFI